MRRDVPGRSSSGALVFSPSNDRWREDRINVDTSKRRIVSGGVEIANDFDSDSSPVDFLITASNCALQADVSQLPRLEAEFAFLPKSVIMPWHCFIVPWSELADPWISQPRLPADIAIIEQRRSQLTASAWTVANSSVTVAMISFFSIIYRELVERRGYI